jgi:hypothetical protein
VLDPRSVLLVVLVEVTVELVIVVWDVFVEVEEWEELKNME